MSDSFHLPPWIAAPKLENCGLYVIKDDQTIQTITEIARKSCVIFGRNESMSNIILGHPSISRRHAFIAHGSSGNIYIVDLGSSHGTYLNGARLEKNKRMALNNEDIIIFGRSTRHYHVTLDLDIKHNLKKRKINTLSSDLTAPATKRIKLDENNNNYITSKIIANPRIEQTTDSKLIQKGIQTIEYVYSFGIIGYIFADIDRSKPLFIVIQHKKNKQWSFPKGRFKIGKESIYGYDTAKREFEEETGIEFNKENIVSVDWNNPFVVHYQYEKANKLIKKWTTLFSVELTSNVQPKIVRSEEINDIKLMTLEQFNLMNKYNEYKKVIHELNKKLVTVDEIDYNLSKLLRSKKRDKNYKQISKTLSWILRHGARSINLKITNDGWVDINDLLNTRSLKAYHTNFDDIAEMVRNDKKLRFSMIQNNDRWKIRANQGHSMEFIDSDKLLIKLSMDDIRKLGDNICHGTYYKHYNDILENGLNKMRRKHIHFAMNDNLSDGDVQSGMRSNCEILIYVDITKCVNDGIVFYKSMNNVILTEGNENGYILPKYFTKITEFNNNKPGKIIYPRK